MSRLNEKRKIGMHNANKQDLQLFHDLDFFLFVFIYVFLAEIVIYLILTTKYDYLS